MAQIVYVHGIAQQLKGPEILAREWSVALRDGMRHANCPEEALPPDESIKVAFYGDLFRAHPDQDGTDADVEKGDTSSYVLADIEDGIEADLLLDWAETAGIVASADSAADETEKSGRAPRSFQKAAVALLSVPFFAGLTDSLLVGALKQVRWYLTKPAIREEARRRVAALLSDETRLVIGHSLGSIVAYEVLCRAAQEIKPAFVTIGSPLGLPNLIFERLDPRPIDGTGARPGTIRSWTNIADKHDIVASVKKLNGLFDGQIVDVLVDNESLAHDIQPYFTASETGAAVLAAFRGH